MTNEKIISRLHEVEREYGVRVLLAVESGSRAWGFASPLSDWDVRFVYVHPVDWYLKVEPGRDTIEIMDDDGFDASGWDLRKALQLFKKTNSSVVEYLMSPIKYIDEGGLAETLRGYLPYYYHALHAAHCYYSIAEKTNRPYFERDGVMLKRFLYYLRGLLACEWILDRGTAPPVPFRELVMAMVNDRATLAAIDVMLEKKAKSKDHYHDPVDPLLVEYAFALSEDVKRRMDEYRFTPSAENRDDELDRLLLHHAMMAAGRLEGVADGEVVAQ